MGIVYYFSDHAIQRPTLAMTTVSGSGVVCGGKHASRSHASGKPTLWWWYLEKKIKKNAALRYAPIETTNRWIVWFWVWDFIGIWLHDKLKHFISRFLLLYGFDIFVVVIFIFIIALFIIFLAFLQNHSSFFFMQLWKFATLLFFFSIKLNIKLLQNLIYSYVNIFFSFKLL